MIDRKTARGPAARGSLRRAALALALMLVAPVGVTRAQPPRDQDAGRRPAPGTSAASPAKALVERAGGLVEGATDRLLGRVQATWPDPPEWAAMLIDILKGSQLGPGEGWFKKAVAQTRYHWDDARRRLDRNRDGRLDRAEFPGADADFARLDRDRDGSLTGKDFDFSAHALTPSPGAMIFYAADRDGNGKVTREELDALFRAADSGGAEFLSLGDLQEALTPPSRGRGSSGPSRLTLVKGLFRQEIGSLQPGPALGTPAPDFTLKTVDGKQDVALSKLIGPKPVVLIFGNFTCGPFRSQAGNVEKLYRRYKDRATFVMVYVREAHPSDGWRLESNNRLEILIPQPRNDAERVQVAQMCNKRLELGMPMLVDTIGDTVGARYSGMPSRLYLLDHRGRVAYKSGRGPFGFKPAELEHSLLLLLQDEFPELKSRESGAAAAASRGSKDIPVADARPGQPAPPARTSGVR
jgi:thiol-disulfide isomerase/thioredoxin